MTTMPSFLTASSKSAVSLDPLVGSEILTGIAQVLLDFAGMFSSSKSLIRLYADDYLLDYSIHTEELSIQLSSLP
jgi:hypothetical protein